MRIFMLIIEHIFAYSEFEIYKIWGGEVLQYILDISNYFMPLGVLD